MSTESFEKEMNRGFIQLLTLVLLEKPGYGYQIVKEFEHIGYQVEENSLYPLLRRLEAKGVLKSTWEIEENKPRKYYVISDQGRELRERLLDIWRNQHRVLSMKGGDSNVQKS